MKTGITITQTEHDAVNYLVEKSGSAQNAIIHHRKAQADGGWAQPGPDISVLNRLSNQAMFDGMKYGWNVQSDLLGANPVPTQLSVSAEQMNAVEALLKAFEYDIDTLLSVHRSMLAIGGWKTPGREILNDLSVADIQGIFSADCKVDVRTPKPVTLQVNPNGYPLTDGQVKVLEDWFARPENQQYDREDLLRIVRTSGYPADLFVIHAASPQELAIILYAGYKPLSRPDVHAGMNT